MAGKNQILRLIVIDLALRSGQAIHWEELAKRCRYHPQHAAERKVYTEQQETVSEKTIRDDIRFMREHFNAPIPDRNPGRCYRYTDPDFSLFQHPIFMEEVNALQLTVQLLEQFDGLPLSSELQELLHRSAPLKEAANENKLPIVLETPPRTSGGKWLKPLISAITEDRLIQLEYKPFDQDTLAFDQLKPLQIRLYNRRWFLYAHDLNQIEQMLVFPLDRILEVSELNQKHMAGINPSLYCKDLFGVSRAIDSEAQQIIIRVQKPRAHYLASKPLHESLQVVSDSAQAIIFSLHLHINNELITELLHYLGDLEVIEPEQLKLRIAERCKHFLGEKS